MRKKKRINLICNQAWTIYKSRKELYCGLIERGYNIKIFSEDLCNEKHHTCLLTKRTKNSLVNTALSLYNFCKYIYQNNKNELYILYSTKINILFGSVLRLSGGKYICVVAGLGKLYSSNSLVIENWISTNFLIESNKSTKFASDQTVIALVGNCSEIKNHEVLLRAVKNNPKFLVVHIGDGSGATAEERRLFTELEDSKQILNLGIRSDIDQLLRKCHLFAMPSLVEGFGLALAEAMAIGLPCIISRTHGLSWAENQPGVIVVKEGLTWDSVLNQIHNSEILDLSEKARQSRTDYKYRFSPKRGVREYVEVYDS